MNSNYAVVVDCRSRGLQVFAASVTEAADRGLVLRKAAELGKLAELRGGEISQTVVFLGSYSAQSSAGFVTVAKPEYYPSRFLAGASGLGWEKEGGRRGDALRPMTYRDGGKIPVTVIMGGCSLTKVGGHANSNCATAEAARAGLKLRAEMRVEVIILEGQSDYVTGWAFKPAQPQNRLGGEFPAEHRGDVFAPKTSSESSSAGADDDFIEVEDVAE